MVYEQNGKPRISSSLPFCFYLGNIAIWTNTLQIDGSCGHRNVEGVRVIDKEKATRYTACYLAVLGICFMALGYFIKGLSERQLILIIACFIPLNLIVLIPYMVAQSLNMR